MRSLLLITVALACLASVMALTDIPGCKEACPQNVAVVCGRVGDKVYAFRNRCYLPCFHATFVANWPCKVSE
ncbi:unnamed protein product [Leptidea sinapis]|uniref:Kazal-like domain-containing protein n=1 Tax=Leptidea sinapis TaxID=189913 RepID=A0A5E4R7M5_9NEOP|nr:unnamed protein product [Leptidea sinapis]